MIVVREPVAPPQPWMPAVWEHDGQGLPVRHRPDRPHGDLWIARCSNETEYRFVFLMDFSPLREVLVLTPCLACLEMEQP